MSSFYMPEEKTFELPPAGMQTAVFLRITDLGTQTSKFGPKRQAAITWELVDEMMSNGKPYTVTRRYYNVSSNKNSAFRQDIEGCLGKALTAQELAKLDLSDLLGRVCALGIRHETGDNGKVYANVMSVMKAPKGVATRMSPSGEPVCFNLNARPFAQFEYDLLPSWQQKIIAESPEYQAAHAVPDFPEDEPTEHDVPSPHDMADAELDDDVPDWVTAA